jgi:hypothetical protein
VSAIAWELPEDACRARRPADFARKEILPRHRRIATVDDPRPHREDGGFQMP